MVNAATQQELRVAGRETGQGPADGVMSLPASSEVSAGLDALARATRILKKAGKQLDEPVPAKIGKTAAELAACDVGRIAALAKALESWVEHERATRGARLRSELRQACEVADVPLAVLSRDPLELYLAPLTVRIDVEADRADLSFARVRLARCRADGAAVVAAREEQVAQLEGGAWEPETYLTQLRRAWSRTGQGTWVELVDVLPELALLRQSAAFRKDPTARRFEPYPRVQFAYDLWRLRRDRCLAAGGWRLTLGTATGGSTRDKSRVLWLEDGRGGGQFHLTLRFVKEERHD